MHNQTFRLNQSAPLTGQLANYKNGLFVKLGEEDYRSVSAYVMVHPVVIYGATGDPVEVGNQRFRVLKSDLMPTDGRLHLAAKKAAPDFALEAAPAQLQLF